MGEIYKITNLVNDKCYIGKTKYESAIRWRDHINGYHPSSSIHKAIKKYGINNFSFEIIENNVSECLLNDLEQYYINLFNSKTPNGYNLTDGGDCGKGYKPTIETLAKMSACRKGVPWTPLQREVLSKCRVGNNNAGKPVAMIDRNTHEVLKTFKSVVQASKETGIERSTIQKCANGYRPSAGGFLWILLRKD